MATRKALFLVLAFGLVGCGHDLHKGVDADAGSEADAETAIVDASPVDAALSEDASPDAAPEPAWVPGWLYVHDEGTAGQTRKRLYLDGEPWRARGMNIFDTRGCGGCSYHPPNVDEVKRIIDVAVDDWGATLLRLNLMSWPDSTPGNRKHWLGIIEDPDYRDDVVEIVNHIASKGVYVLVHLHAEPSYTEGNLPTAETYDKLALLATLFANEPHVLLGVTNEPCLPEDPLLEDWVWAAMDKGVKTIRAAEQEAGGLEHIVVVQGPSSCAKNLQYYVDHPMTDDNVAYEVHNYGVWKTFAELVGEPAQTLPVIAGEVGPADGGMTLGMTMAFLWAAEAMDVPWTGWVFHHACGEGQPHNMLVDTGSDYGNCDIGMDLVPTEWGAAVMHRLATPWGEF